jgi:Tol biopolymer transport system component
MDWDGSGQTRLTNTFEISEGQPAWSPDGRRLLYRQTQDNPIVQNADIWQIDVDPAAPNPRPVLQRTGDERHRSFSPDGTRIVFESARDSGDARRPDVYVMDADGSDVRRLTADPAHDEGPVWSPDGRQILFTSDRAGRQEIHRMDAGGSRVRRLTDDPAREESPDWQPVPFDTAGPRAWRACGAGRGRTRSTSCS